MTLNNAYCFCPNFLNTISPESVTEALLHKRNSIFLDDQNILMEEYARVLSNNVELFSLCTIFEHAVPSTQKLYSTVTSIQVGSNFLLETVNRGRHHPI
jgi:hypothetical protein